MAKNRKLKPPGKAQYLTYKEAAAVLGCTIQRVQQMTREGKLCRVAGRPIRVIAAGVQQHLLGLAGKRPFRIYGGSDVNADFIRVHLPLNGIISKVWARLHHATTNEQHWIGEEYLVEILGWGKPPFVSFSELPVEVQAKLKETLV